MRRGPPSIDRRGAQTGGAPGTGPHPTANENMAITAKMVSELRAQTGAGMMDCKKALAETNGDFDAAVDWLRKKGQATAAKKASREMGEGRVYAAIDDSGRKGAMIAVTCETDFVAKTPQFVAFLDNLANHVLEQEPADVDALLQQPYQGGVKVEQALKELIGSLGENMNIARCELFDNPEGWVAAYVHHDDRQSALVSVTTKAQREKAAAPLKAVCQHIVVHAPPFCRRGDVPAELIEREKDIHRDSVANKPADIQEKILAGKMEKFYASQVLPEQPWIHDDKLSVEKALVQELGQGTRIEGFAHFKIGG